MPDPDLAVIIASCVGPPYITRCLESLEGQRDQGAIEFIVVDRAGGAVAEEIQRRFPWVTLISRPAGESVPDLRRYAIEQAKAKYVAIIEEHCVASDDWIATIFRGIEASPAVIGGVVADDDYDRLVDWAVYFTEYNAYMPPIERGQTYDVCAANCVYRRDLMLEHLPPKGSGYWEAGLNTTLLQRGERFEGNPDLVVRHTGPFGLFYYLGQRYLFSRAFAGTRRAHVSAGFRFVYLFAAPLLIPLLWARMAARIRAKKHRFGKFLLVTPIMLPVTATYVFGEWVGFLLGPGDSLSRIE